MTQCLFFLFVYTSFNVDKLYVDTKMIMLAIQNYEQCMPTKAISMQTELDLKKRKKEKKLNHR